MTSLRSTDPDQVFRATVTVHAALTVAVVVYVMVGEVMAWSDPEFEGYVFSGGDTMMWILRCLFLGVAPLQVTFGMVVRGMADRATLQGEQVDAGLVAARLQTAQISRAAPLEAIAVFGLILYMLGGERLDLYGFCVISFLSLLLVWPRRALWESTFRSLALKHPNIPSDPWHPELEAN